MSEQQKNVLESITPVELLMAADIKDVTEKEWSEALDACCKDLEALTTPSRVPMVRRMQQVVQTQLSSRNRTATNDATIRYCTLADCFPKYIRCYVARARRAAKPKASHHMWARSMDIPPFFIHDTVVMSDWSDLEKAAIKRLADGLASVMPPWHPTAAPAENKAQAQQPVIPENGYCWAKKPDGSWVYVACRATKPTVICTKLYPKLDNAWTTVLWGAGARHATLPDAMSSLEDGLALAPQPKPADENTPWIVLTADGKLELEKVPVVEFKTQSYGPFRYNLADIQASAYVWGLRNKKTSDAIQKGMEVHKAFEAALKEAEAPLKPWKERPEDLYWFRVNAGYYLLDSKDPNKTWGVTAGTVRARAFYEKEQGFSPLPVVRTSGYWLFGADDRLHITVDGKEYMANGPNQARFIEKEKGWPSLPVHFAADASVDKCIAADDAKDAEGWEWLQLPGDSFDLAHKGIFRGAVSLNPCVRKGPAWMASVSEMSRAVLCFLPFQASKEEAMRALEKHYNLPRLNRP